MIRRFIALILAAGTSACSMEPHDLRPALPVATSWPTGDAYLKQAEAPLPTVNHRDVFRDLRLQQLIALALTNNRDLRIAAANIAAARARLQIQRAELVPGVDAAASYRDARGANSASATLGVTAFEIDLFGRVRSLSNAAQDRYFATEAAAHATRLALVGDIATAWLTCASDRSLLKIAQDSAISARHSVALTKARLDGGIAARSDLDQASSILQTALSDEARQTTAAAQDINALELLVGTTINPELLPLSIEEAAPTIAELPAGLDSRVLLRRPDVVQAEHVLRAANAEIGAARAQLFPHISLTTLLGFASNGLSNLFTGGTFSYSVTPSVTLPIFSAGAGKANLAQSRAQRDAALAGYEKAIQTAFREVSDALARRGTIADQERAQRALAEAARDNYTLADARYRGGIETFLQSLDAQRSFYAAQRGLVATELTKATNLVTLYRTLGGDSRLDPARGGD